MKKFKETVQEIRYVTKAIYTVKLSGHHACIHISKFLKL